jgi:hypothetical protein
VRSNRAATRTLVSLCRQRLASRFGPRVGWFAVAFVALTFGAAAASVQPGQGVGPVVADAIRWCCWLGAAPVALVAAAAPAGREGRDGITALLRLHGVGRSRVSSARFVAAMLEAAIRVVVPALVVTVWALVVARPSQPVALVAGVIATSGVVGLVVGGLGAACGHWAREKGRTMLFAVVLLPWMIAESWALSRLSVVGLVDRAIVFFVEGIA